MFVCVCVCVQMFLCVMVCVCVSVCVYMHVGITEREKYMREGRENGRRGKRMESGRERGNESNSALLYLIFTFCKERANLMQLCGVIVNRDLDWKIN